MSNENFHQYMERDEDTRIRMPSCVQCGDEPQTRGGSLGDRCRAEARVKGPAVVTTRIPGPAPTRYVAPSYLHVVPDPPAIRIVCGLDGCKRDFGRQSDLTQHRKAHARLPKGELMTMTDDRPSTADPLAALIAAPGMLARLVAARGGLVPIGRIEHVVRGDGVVLARLIADEGIEG